MENICNEQIQKQKYKLLKITQCFLIVIIFVIGVLQFFINIESAVKLCHVSAIFLLLIESVRCKDEHKSTSAISFIISGLLIIASILYINYKK